MSQGNLNVRKGDTVVVIAGKDKGKQGKVLACFPAKQRITVEGVNIISRHTKPKSAQDKGGIIKKEGSIHVSNVMIVCPACGKATRVYHKMEDGKKIRVCKCGKSLDAASAKVEKKTAKKAPAKKVDTADAEKAQAKKTATKEKKAEVEVKAEKKVEATEKKAPAKKTTAKKTTAKKAE